MSGTASPRHWGHSSEQDTDILVERQTASTHGTEKLEREPERPADRLPRPVGGSQTKLAKPLMAKHYARRGGTPVTQTSPCPQ